MPNKNDLIDMLDWRPMNEPPTEENEAHLLYSGCDGYHVVYNYEGEFCSFEDVAGRYPYEAESYLAWAILPLSPNISHLTDKGLAKI